MAIREVTFPMVVKKFRTLINRNRDVIVAVTGYTGFGKSTLALQLAMWVNPAFSLKNDVLYLVESHKFIQKFIGTFRQVLVLDEATKNVHKHDWATQWSKEIRIVFDTERRLSNILFMCMPSFSEFNTYFRNDRLYYWFHIIAQGYDEKHPGVVVVFERIDNPFGRDAWHMDDGEKLMKNCAGYSTKQMIKELSKHPNFKGYMLFKALPKPLLKEYEYYKAVSRENLKDGAEDQFDGLNKFGARYKVRYHSILEIVRVANPRLKWADIGKILGVGEEELKSIKNSHFSFLNSDDGKKLREALPNCSIYTKEGGGFNFPKKAVT